MRTQKLTRERSLIFPVIYAQFLFCFSYWCRREQFLHRLPGQWLGQDFFFTSRPVAFLALAVLVGLIVCTWTKRKWLALLMLAATLPFFLLSTPEPESRIRAEESEYRRVVQSGARFGDQFSAELDGRRVVFWRWVTYDIDEGEGVIYVPEDRFQAESASRLQYGPHRDTIFKVIRISPNLYWVKFT